MVDSTAPTTYYEVLGWNNGQDGGGYTGIQDHPNLGHIFIHALWNPSTGGTISNVYAEVNALVEPFGGEGEGMHILTRPKIKVTSMGCGQPPPEVGSSWDLNKWYTILTRNWDYQGSTYYGVWIKDQSAGTWRPMVTWRFPQRNQHFNCCSNSFLENWSGGSLELKRRMYTKNGWKHYTSGNWIFFNQGAFDFNTIGGVKNNAFYMETDPKVAPNIFPANSMQNISAPGSGPNITTGQPMELSSFYNSSLKTVTISWKTDKTKAPQFSYLIEIFDNSNLSGTPIINFSDTAPHLRSSTINVSSLAPNKTYYVRFSIADVINQKSKFLNTNFYKNN